jgi:hypothetical protein
MVGFYQNLNVQFSTSHRFFRLKDLQDASIDNVFFWINPVEKCTQSFPRCYVNREKVKSWCLLVTAPSIIKQALHWSFRLSHSRKWTKSSEVAFIHGTPYTPSRYSHFTNLLHGDCAVTNLCEKSDCRIVNLVNLGTLPANSDRYSVKRRNHSAIESPASRVLSATNCNFGLVSFYGPVSEKRSLLCWPINISCKFLDSTPVLLQWRIINWF